MKYEKEIILSNIDNETYSKYKSLAIKIITMNKKKEVIMSKEYMK